MDVHGVSFPPPAVWAYMVYPFLLQAEWICRVCPCPPPTSTTSSVDVQGVFISPPAVHAGCTAYSFSPPTMLTYYHLQGIQSGTGMLLYRIEIPDAGMPMPSYATRQ